MINQFNQIKKFEYDRLQFDDKYKLLDFHILILLCVTLSWHESFFVKRQD